jgi:protein transport protein SEC24
VDPDKAFAVQIAHEESVVAGPVAYMQCALLYTSSNGERRIRCAATFGLLCCVKHLSSL